MNRKRVSSRARRAGAAVIELAICLPVIALIVVGTIESANMLFLRQALVQSSYEAAKVAIHREGTNAAAINVANQVAAGRRLTGLQITFTPSDVATVPRGTPINVTVSAPSDSNSIFNFAPYTGKTLSGTAVMIKE